MPWCWQYSVCCCRFFGGVASCIICPMVRPPCRLLGGVSLSLRFLRSPITLCVRCCVCGLFLFLCSIFGFGALVVGDAGGNDDFFAFIG